MTIHLQMRMVILHHMAMDHHRLAMGHHPLAMAIHPRMIVHPMAIHHHPMAMVIRHPAMDHPLMDHHMDIHHQEMPMGMFGSLGPILAGSSLTMVIVSIWGCGTPAK